jgi:hypothetical protein
MRYNIDVRDTKGVSKMTIKARYPGRCSKCGQPIRPGDEIDWDKYTKKTSHIVCPKKAEKPAAPQAPPKNEDAPITLYRTSRSRISGPPAGEIIKTQQGNYVVVVSTSTRYISRDECADNDDYTYGGNPYWQITAHCRPAKDEEIPQKAQ